MPWPSALCALFSIVSLLSAVPTARCTNAAGLLFLKENALKHGVMELPSGMQYRIIVDGHGRESPASNTSCLMHYVGTLIDGTEFDSSYKRGKVCCIVFATKHPQSRVAFAAKRSRAALDDQRGARGSVAYE
jgi:hypothetical protein